MADWDDLKTKTAELLDHGLQTGVLSPEEHAWRQGHLAKAASVQALEDLVQDLLVPVAPAGTKAVGAPRSSQMTVMSNRHFQLADLGRRTDLVTLMGSSRIDLRGLGADEGLNLELVTIMGDTVVEVPAGVKVRVDAVPVMGDCHVAPSVRDSAGSVRISGVVLMGSLRVVVAKTPS